MKAAAISLLDFTSPLELGKTRHGELLATLDLPVIVHHERFNGARMEEAIEQVASVVIRTKPDLLILLLSQEAQSAARNIFRALLGPCSAPPVVVVPWTDEPAAISECLHLGASEYFIPPFRLADVRPRLQRLLASACSRGTIDTSAKSSPGLPQFVGESAAVQEQLRKIPAIARCDAGVLITGETGTGKEVCARAIHYLSPRADHPFVPLNCGAIPIDLVENELFGHEAGAFTGANGAHPGVICQANGGTLFLDEIDALPLAAQVKLLRFLQEKEYRPLGAAKSRKADVRIIAAANARIEDLLKAGKMRQDLFYRLNVLPVHLPPLRQRQEDVSLLARHFVTKYAVEMKGKARDITHAALHKLSLHDWPGNVRELENVIERAVALCGGEVIEVADIDLPFTELESEELPSFSQLKARVIADFEREYVVKMLNNHEGNIARAARAARKNRRVFFRLMGKHHIRVERSTGTTDGQTVVKMEITVDKKVHPSIPA